MDDHGAGGAESEPVTVLGRLLRAGLGEERAREWIAVGGARVDGEPVTDPDRAAPPPARVVLYGA